MKEEERWRDGEMERWTDEDRLMDGEMERDGWMERWRDEERWREMER